MAAAVQTDEITPIMEDSWTDCMPVLILPQTQLLYCLCLVFRLPPCLASGDSTANNSVDDKVSKSSPYYLGRLSCWYCWWTSQSLLWMQLWPSPIENTRVLYIASSPLRVCVFSVRTAITFATLCYEYMISVLGRIIWSEASLSLCCWIWPRILLLTFSIAYILRLCLCVQLLSGRALLNSMVSVKMKLSPWQTGKTKKCELWILYKPVWVQENKDWYFLGLINK